MLLILLGCASPDGSAFAGDRAEAICAWHARCGTLEAAGFTDEADCVDALNAAAAQMGRDNRLGCDGYDPEAAEACLAVWEQAECGAPLDLGPCEAVCAG